MAHRKQIILIVSLIVITLSLVGVTVFNWVFGAQLKEALSFQLESSSELTSVYADQYNLSFDVPKDCEFKRYPIKLTMSTAISWKGDIICKGGESINLSTSIRHEAMQGGVEDRINEIKETYTSKGHDRVYFRYIEDVGVTVFAVLSVDEKRYLIFRGSDHEIGVLDKIVDSMKLD